MSLIDHEQSWLQQLPMIKAIRNKGIKSLFQSLPNIQDAFKNHESLCCIDGGVTEGVHLPGSGVLHSFESLTEFVLSRQIREVTTHDECGAFMKAFPDHEDPNLGSLRWGEEIANQLGLKHRHISIDEMDRPSGIHNESVVYYDATCKFNRIEGMPVGFVVSRHDKQDAQSALDLAIQIAFGPVGFGNRFDLATPLHVVAITDPVDPNLSLRHLQREINEVTKNYGPYKTAVTGYKTAWVLRAANA